MAQDDSSSNNNEQWVKSEAYPKEKPDASLPESTGKLLADIKARAAMNPDDERSRDLLARLEQSDQVASSPERGGAGQRYGLDGRPHEPAEKATDIVDQGREAKPIPVADVQRDEKHVLMARAYVEKTPQQAVAEYPELAKVYVARAAAETQLADRPPEGRQIVMNRFDERVISQIEQGKLPAVQINEKVTQEVAVGRERHLNA
jgi:hypothetical protein